MKIPAITSLAILAGVLGATTSVKGATTVPLVLPQWEAFSILGHSCGGIQEHVFATGFDATTGYPTGVVYMQTVCGGSGRGGGYHSTTYAAWASVTWDFTGAAVTFSALSVAPTVNPTFSAFDAYGNEIYNASNNAYLVLSPTFVPAPRVTGVSTTAGPAVGGTSVTITGTGFTGATSVTFGTAAAASFTVGSDTSITAVSPSTSAGTVYITVTSAGGTSADTAAAQFTFVAAPSVSGLIPNSGPIAGGTAVTITGSGFTGATSVSFGDTPVGFAVIDDTTIFVVSPASDAADTVSISVTTIGGTSASSPSSQFTYVVAVSVGAPTVTNLSPNYGTPSGGTTVTITGKNFAGTTAITFGAAAAISFTVLSPTSIIAISPPGTDIVDVMVQNLYGISPITSHDVFHYGPIISKLSPTQGSAGGSTKVTISGHNFTGATAVAFGARNALSFTVNAYGTAITAVSPAEDGTGIQSVDVSVIGPNGTSLVTAADVFSYVPPLITKVYPATGSAGGNTKVTVYGHYFVGATDVAFGGVPAVHFTVNSTGTAITAVTPPEAGTGVQTVDLSVTTAAGTSSLASSFTYAAPTVTLISPVSGPATGGTTVVITGTNLYGATAVNFGATPATITKMSATSLTVISPPGTGTVDVTVTSSAGTSTTSAADQFTY